MNTFGDKRALFFESLGVVRHRERSFHQRGIEKTWLGSRRRAKRPGDFAQRKDLSSAEGCMGLNAISEFGQRRCRRNAYHTVVRRGGSVRH